MVRHITLKFVGRYFYFVVTIFSKNRAFLVVGRKKLSKSVFGYFKTKKMAIKFEGGGGGLNGH